MLLRRRALLGGLAGSLAAPAIGRAQSLDGLLYPGQNPPQMLPQGPLALNRSAPTLQGVAGYWPLAGDARDYSGNGNNGTLVGGPAIVMGPMGPALSLNGSSQYMQAPRPSAIVAVEATSSFSISVWGIPNALGAQRGWFSIGGSSTETAAPILAGQNASNQFTFYDTVAYKPGGTVVSGALYNLVITHAPNSWTLYVNGASVSTSTQSMVASRVWTNIYIGAGFPNPFSGTIWGAEAWPRMLSQAEVTALYTRPFAALMPATTSTYASVGTVTPAGGSGQPIIGGGVGSLP